MITHSYFAKTKVTPVERQCAIGMLQANVVPSVAAKQFRCHVRRIGRLKNRFQQTWTTSDRPRAGRHRVLTRRQDLDIPASHLSNQFYLETVSARTYPGTHYPRISAKTEKLFSRDLFKTPTSQRLTDLKFGAVFHQIKEPPAIPTSK